MYRADISLSLSTKTLSSMALVTIEESSSSKHLQLESIPIVDLRLFSQSDLNSLSHCSNQAFDLHPCDEIVIPKIDRSIFNESAGSRKQTYSRLRLAPRVPDIELRHRRFLSLSKPPQNPIPIDDSEREEKKQIVSLLEELFAKDNCNDNDPGTEIISIFSQEDEVSLFPEPLNVENGVVSEGEKGKRKREENENNQYLNQKGKMQGDGSKAIVAYNQEFDSEIVNCNDVAVDIAALANMDDPFGPELMRRTVGLETEAELLQFLGSLEGKWGSMRKKKRIVDASYFGDHLPMGWKILIGIRKKGGRLWLSCSQYISPNGLKFVFCKEVSSYLQSVFGAQETNQTNPYQGYEIHRDSNLMTGEIAGLTHGDEWKREDLPSLSTENQAVLLRVEHLAEVEVKDLLECLKCKRSFVEKDAYLLHLSTSHQSAAKCGLKTSVCDGLVTSDGKFEGQSFHGVFQENHLYNDYIGVHTKNYAESLEALQKMTVPKSEHLSMSGILLGVSSFDESVDINSSSTLQASAELKDGMNVMNPAPGSVNTQSYSKLDVSSPYRYHDTGGIGSTLQIAAAKPNDSSSQRKLDLDMKPLPDSKNIEDKKMDFIVADESCDEQYRGYEIDNDKLGEIIPISDQAIDEDKIGLTLAGESCANKDRGNEIADEMLGMTNDPNIDLDIEDDKIDLTLAGESNDKQYRCYEIANEKLGEIDDSNCNHAIGDDKVGLTLVVDSYDKPYEGSDIAGAK